MAEHLLIVDDDKEICALLSQFMTQHGYRISVAHEGRAMMQTLESARIDLVVLDVMLPGESGLSLCRRVRSSATVPIVMLTAVGGETDRIVGLEMGADDYLPKPFNPRELLARVRAVLRRAGGTSGSAPNGTGRALEFVGWRLDVTGRRLFSPACHCAPPNSISLSHLPSGRSAFSIATNCSTSRVAEPPPASTAASTCRSAGCGASSKSIPMVRT
jgi:DNA-binding response OmpR family regulator